jgi:hypothetical protein
METITENRYKKVMEETIMKEIKITKIDISKTFVSTYFLKQYVNNNKKIPANIKQKILEDLEDTYTNLWNVLLDFNINPTEVLKEAGIELDIEE